MQLFKMYFKVHFSALEVKTTMKKRLQVDTEGVLVYIVANSLRELIISVSMLSYIDLKNNCSVARLS